MKSRNNYTLLKAYKSFNYKSFCKSVLFLLLHNWHYAALKLSQHFELRSSRVLEIENIALSNIFSMIFYFFEELLIAEPPFQNSPNTNMHNVLNQWNVNRIQRWSFVRSVEVMSKEQKQHIISFSLCSNEWLKRWLRIHYKSFKSCGISSFYIKAQGN